ncbi:MAG: DUF305 domain-containing protein [Thermosynechococcaceae cyanobacterium]
MQSQSMVYGIAGLVTGSIATVVVMAAMSHGSGNISEALSLKNPSSPLTAQSAQPVKSNPSAPFQIGRMGDPDAHFIVMMIPHHDGAIDMADLALSRAKHPELKQLATQIKAAQAKEIAQMRTWYKAWYGADVPTWSSGNTDQPLGVGMGMMHHGGSDGGAGMMGGNIGSDLDVLEKAPDFDREFIRQMIPHHQMAVMMTSMLLSSSQRPEMRQLGQAIIDGQTAEIKQMQDWYRQWYP